MPLHHQSRSPELVVKRLRWLQRLQRLQFSALPKLSGLPHLLNGLMNSLINAECGQIVCRFLYFTKGETRTKKMQKPCDCECGKAKLITWKKSDITINVKIHLTHVNHNVYNLDIFDYCRRAQTVRNKMPTKLSDNNLSENKKGAHCTLPRFEFTKNKPHTQICLQQRSLTKVNMRKCKRTYSVA